MFFKTYGLLGQNARNLKYIKGFNTKLATQLADSKLKTKEFLKSKGVPVPETLATLSNHDEITIDFVHSLTPPFVIKPNKGFGGKGIIVVDSKDSMEHFVSNTGETYSESKIKSHLLHVLDGFFSLSGSRDKVIIERKIEIDQEVQILGKYGLPDVRIIVFNMVPVMAMLRIPTEKSGGKANLHSGACAAGIDIGSGRLTYITQHSSLIKTIKGIGDVRGIIIPNWDKMLSMAVTVQKETSIGYLGCDIVMDDIGGPLLLEVNVRPGLEVQIANMAKLKERLEKVEGININSVAKGVRLGRDLFSGDIEEKIRNISGKKVLGMKEYVSLHYNEKTFTYLADIRPSHSESSLDLEFATKILKINLKKDTKRIRIETDILGDNKHITFIIKKDQSSNIILGINTLRGFILDPFKYKKGQTPIHEDSEYKKTINIAVKRNYESQLKKLDMQLLMIDKKLLIIKALTPTNIKKEREKFITSKGKYIPQFKYNIVSLNFTKLFHDLNIIEIPDIPLSGIYIRKKEEIFNKLKFLEAFSQGNGIVQTKYSKKIFGKINEKNLEYTKEVLDAKPHIKQELEFLDFSEIQDYIKKFNHIYNINIHLKKSNKTARFVMKGDSLLFREGSIVGKKEMRSIVAHEIEGHYLRKYNGKKMDYSIFGHGTAGYLEIDEGIAIYNQNRFLNTFDRKYYGIFEGYYLVDFALNHSYKELLQEVLRICNNDLEKSFNKILRLKRGLHDASADGVFVKDVVYLNGFIKIEHYLHAGGSLKELYLGKISIEDLEELKESYFMKLQFNNSKVPFSL